MRFYIYKKHDFNYLSVTIHSLEILFGKIFDDNDDLIVYSINAPTIIMYDKNDWYKSLTFRLLGFGITITKQNGY